MTIIMDYTYSRMYNSSGAASKRNTNATLKPARQLDVLWTCSDHLNSRARKEKFKILLLPVFFVLNSPWMMGNMQSSG